jgi:hypothetical protein
MVVGCKTTWLAELQKPDSACASMCGFGSTDLGGLGFLDDLFTIISMYETWKISSTGTYRQL